MTDLPAPLVAADVDCTDLDGFMLNVERLMASELVALSTHEVIAAALFLWCRAWKQRPAASLPSDDRVLAAFARLPLPRFRKLRAEVMRGFDLCSDGRYYHRFLSTEALKAFERKEAFRKKRETDADRLRKWREQRSETPSETPSETRFVAEGQGQGRDRDVTEQKDLNGHTHDSVPRDANPVPSAGGFWEFWTAYPLKTGRKDGLRAYADACNRASHEVILAGAQRYAASRDGEDPKFTKSAARWLEGDCWSDETPPPKLSDAERIAREIERRA